MKRVEQLQKRLRAILDAAKTHGPTKTAGAAYINKRKKQFSWKEQFNATPAGSLHAYLGVPAGSKIPLGKLKWAMRQTRTPKEKALAAKAALTYRFAMKRAR